MRLFSILFLAASLSAQVVAVKHRVVTVQAVATPTASPAAGTYSSTQTVSLTSTTSGATICYTTDGTTPAATTPGTCSTGSTYSTSLSVASTQTIRAIATKSGMPNSGVLTAAYTISTFGILQTFAHGHTSATATGTIALTGVTAGNVIVVGVSAGQNSGGDPEPLGATCTDNAAGGSNTYTRVAETDYTTPNPDIAVGIYVGTATNGGNFTISCTAAHSGYLFLTAVELSLYTTMQDGTASGTNTGNASPYSCGSITTSFANSIVIAVMANSSTSSAVNMQASGTGFAIPAAPTATVNSAGNTFSAGGLEYRIAPAGTYSPQFTTIPNQPSACTLIALKAQ